jgi:hypothetical protein
VLNFDVVSYRFNVILIGDIVFCYGKIFFSPLSQQHLLSQNLLSIVSSLSHSDTLHSVALHCHTQTHYTRYDSSERVISSLQRPLSTQHTTNTRDKHPCPQRDSSPRSQPSKGRSPVRNESVWEQSMEINVNIVINRLLYYNGCVIGFSFMIII